MLIADVHVSLLGGLAAAVVFAVVAVLAAWLSYRRTIPPLPTGRRALLTALRSVMMGVLALLLAEPVIQFVDTRTDAPVVAVLLDNTQSVTVAGKDSGDGIRAFLAAAPASGPGGAAVRYFPFTGRITGSFDSPPDDLRFDGQSTNISAALDEIRKRARQENIRAVVLASDGNYNEGRNPLNELDLLSLPVFTAGAGDTVRRKDLLIDRVFTNAIAYEGSTVPVEAYLRGFGIGSQRVEVAVREGNRTVASVPVQLGGGTTEYPVRFSIPAGAEGVHKYVVSVGVLPGELTPANNSQTFFLRVLKSKIRVVLFAGAPFPDASGLKQAIAEDPQMDVRWFVQKSPDTFIGAAPTQAVIDSADCVAFVGFPSALTSGRTIEMLVSSMKRAKKPLLYVHGTSVDNARLRSFDEFLPFTISGANPAEELVFAAVPDRMRSHPLVSGGEGGEHSAASWERLPPVFKMRTVFQARPGSEVIAYARINTVTLTEPLVLTRSLRGLKSFAVTGHGIYRWRLMSQGSPATERFLTSLVSNAVRWLTTRENEKPVRVEPVREIFTSADGVGFRAEVYDDQLRPVDNADVTVRYDAGSGAHTTALEPIGNGRYQGADGPLPAGDYEWRASAKRGDLLLGTDAGKFSVGPVNVEFLSTTMNRQLLEQIAGQSGGGYYSVADAERLWSELAGKADLAPRQEATRKEIELWNLAWLGAALVLMLAVEWFLRKRWALL